MAHLDMDRKRAQEAHLDKLQKKMVSMQETMIEQTMLRKKIENLMDAETARTEKTFDRIQSKNMLLQEEIDRRYSPDVPSSPSPVESNNRVLDEVMALRTREFQKSQAHKAHQIQHLAKERQRILEARNRLQEKKDILRSLPSPVGKATHKHWGHKYSIFSPLPYDGGPRLYTPIYLSSNWGTHVPVWDKHYYTYYPQRKFRDVNRRKRNVVYVPTPLHQSSFF